MIEDQRAPKFIIRALAALLLIAAGGSARAADKLTYILDWVPNGKQAPAYAAVREGYFAEVGLEVTIRGSRGSSDAITRVMTGTGDIASGGFNGLLMAAAESEVPVKAVLSIYNKQADATLTAKGSGITTIKDMAGRNVATGTFTSSNTLWPLIAAMNGLDPATVNLIKAEPNALVPLLAAGKVDAVINWSNSAPPTELALRQVGKEVLVLPWSDFGLEGYGLSLFAPNKLISERPDVVARFVKAFQRGITFALANPEASAKHLQAMVPEVDVANALAEFLTTVPLIKNEISEKKGMGTFDPALLRKSWEWVAKAQGYALDKVDPEKLVDRGFVPNS